MGRVYIDLWCPECNSDNVISNYDEEYNDIICACMNCYHNGLLKDFDYIIEGDIYNED